MRRPLAMLLAPLLLACEGSPPPATVTAPGWHVSGGFVRAPDGRAVILRGVNLGDQKVKPYLDDKQPSDYTRVRADWGMNALRFVITWSAVEPEQGHYDEAYLDGVRERLDWAENAGLFVVLDMHQDIYGEGFGFDGAPRWTCDAAHYDAFKPRAPWFLSALDPSVQACVDHLYTDAATRARFVAAWAHVAERLADRPAVIGVDILNEPLWGSYPIFSFEEDRLLPLDADVMAAVRKVAPGWLAFVEPGASRNVGVATNLPTPGFANVVYSPHSYDQAAEGGGGFDPTHRTTVMASIGKLAAEARALSAALFIGEYGGVASDPGIVEYMTAEYDGASAVAASTMYWDYSKGGYGMLAPDGSEKPLLVDTLVRPYPEKIAGNPVSWSFDAPSEVFTFRYHPDAAITLPTEIVVPARRYSAGYQVECGGCTFEKRPGGVAIKTPPAGNPATVTIHP